MPKVFNAGGTVIATLRFFDEDGEPVVPTAASYRLDTLTAVEIIGDTPIAAPAASVEIEITPAHNAIVDPTLEFEIHKLSGSFTYGLSRTGRVEHLFTIRA